eukprot:1031358-Alexandrium_andersonii.AAC.1
MSASLVGSEMCIRDSLTTTLGPLTPGPRLSGLQAPHGLISGPRSTHSNNDKPAPVYLLGSGTSTNRNGHGLILKLDRWPFQTGLQ